MKNARGKKNPLEYIKNHWVYSVITIVAVIISITWGIVYETNIKPRDVIIEQLNTDLKNVGYIKELQAATIEQQKITIEQQKTTIEQQKREIANFEDKLRQYTEKMTLKGLSFYNTLGTALVEAKEQNKPIFLYIRSNSSACGWCKKFEDETFRNRSVIKILSENFILVSIDVDKQKDEIRDLGVYGTPTEIFLDSNGIEIKRIPGYMDTEIFLKAIDETQHL